MARVGTTRIVASPLDKDALEQASEELFSIGCTQVVCGSRVGDHAANERFHVVHDLVFPKLS